MENMEEKLGAILGNPAMMQQIMALAQNLGQSQPRNPPEPPKQPSPPAEFDTAMLQKFASIAQGSGIDKNQQTLLNALHPYLTDGRIHRLERAMRAAKMANLASAFLGSRSWGG